MGILLLPTLACQSGSSRKMAFCKTNTLQQTKKTGSCGKAADFFLERYLIRISAETQIILLKTIRSSDIAWYISKSLHEAGTFPRS